MPNCPVSFLRRSSQLAADFADVKIVAVEVRPFHTGLLAGRQIAVEERGSQVKVSRGQERDHDAQWPSCSSRG